LPFQDDFPPEAWPLALGYCALLPASAVGIVRVGQRAIFAIAALTPVPMVLGIVGLTIISSGGPSWASGETCLRLSLYSFYPLLLAALLLSIRGWILYWRHRAGEG
jgi:hypothetical protein